MCNQDLLINEELLEENTNIWKQLFRGKKFCVNSDYAKVIHNKLMVLIKMKKGEVLLHSEITHL